MAVSFVTLMNSEELLPALTEAEGRPVAGMLESALSVRIYRRSLAFANKTCFFLAAKDGDKMLGVVSNDKAVLDGFTGTSGQVTIDGTGFAYKLCPLETANADALRARLPYLRAVCLGLRKSVGCGDRLGLATPGHVRAVRGTGMALIAAQQSVRENSRTGRNPQQVMDEAMWGIFEEGWREGFGGDADHLKTPQDTAPWIAAGFTFYTIDPGEHVDNDAEHADVTALREKVASLPWDVLESSPEDLVKRLTQPVDIGVETITMTEEQVLRAAAKYGKAVAHTVRMYRHLAGEMGEDNFELEVSVDETATVTRIEEHIYIANELRRLGVKWVSLAPRYVGEFQKGVDYIGDLETFRKQFARHVAVAKTFGPYKLSLHSGSDKFSIYPIVAELAGDLVHLKTAGTSYLEALRTVAQVNPSLFREIMQFAMGRYETDRATYFVSGELSKVPHPASLEDNELVGLLDQFDARQVLHVTFGSVLNHPPFGEGIVAALKANEETHYELVAKHFMRHISPFMLH